MRPASDFIYIQLSNSRAFRLSPLCSLPLQIVFLKKHLAIISKTMYTVQVSIWYADMAQLVERRIRNA